MKQAARISFIAAVVCMLPGGPAAGQQYTNQRYEVTPISSVSELRPSTVTGDRVGEALAMDERYIVLGAPGTAIDGIDNAGLVYVYDAQSEELLYTLQSPTPGTDDVFGAAIALDGDLIAVGAWNDDELATDGGAVFLFDAKSGSLIEKLRPTDPDEEDRFGYSIALGDAYIVVGVVNDDTAGSTVGSVEVFDRGTRTHLGKLVPDDPADVTSLGFSVAILGDKVIAGAPNSDLDGFRDGAVYAFDLSTMSQMYMVRGSDTAGGDEFGSTLALIPGGFAVGAEMNDGDESNAGAVYLFDLETGTERARVRPYNPRTNAHFGSSLHADGDRLIVGARRNNTEGNNSGRAYLFNARTGQMQAHFAVDTLSAGDQLGVAVAISGDSVIAGAARALGTGNLAGQVYRFMVDGTRYADRAFVGADCSTENRDQLGYAIDIDGDLLVTSSVDAGHCALGSGTGGFYVFDIPTGTTLLHRRHPGGQFDDSFGWSVAIGDGVIAVGAPTASDIALRAGMVYLFNADTGEPIGMIHPDNLAEDDRFGYSLDIDQGVLAVSAYWANTPHSSSAGKVYLFDLHTGDLLHELQHPMGYRAEFGFDVHMSGGLIVVGAPRANDGMVGGGAAFVFDVETGGHVQTLVATDSYTRYMGRSVFLDGEYLIAGAPETDHFPPDAGRITEAGEAVVFDLASGMEVARLRAKLPDAYDRFGWSIAMDEETIYLGMRRNHIVVPEGRPDPLVERFDRSTFERLEPVRPSFGYERSWFGVSLAISDEYIAAGMPNTWPDTDYNALGGAVFVYDQPPGEACAGDFNGDGVLNFFDLSDFIGAYTAGGLDADLDGDGRLTFFDLSAFIIAYNAGCP